MTRRDAPIRLATRGSDLARRQTALVAEALEDRRHEVEVVEVETRGDEIRDELIHRLGKTGAFVRALDEKVRDGEVDAAVHSLKDVPTEGGEDLVVAAVPERADPGDALVTPDGATLDDLPEGATVGTSSLRRTAQLLDARPDLDVRPLRGNVDTRVEKLLAPHLQAEHERRVEAQKERAAAEERDRKQVGDDGTHTDDPEYDRPPEEWFEDLSELERQAMERTVDETYDAIVLAVAGLERSGLAESVPLQRLPTAQFVPAPGQGAIAVTGRDDEVAGTIHSALDHPRSRVETTVERIVLAELGGGCIAPVGVYAQVRGEHVHVDAQVYSADGTESATLSRDLPAEEYALGARQVAADLADRGAKELIAAAREDE